MSAYLLHVDGDPISIGTRIADPVPAGTSVVELTDDQFAGLASGTHRWDVVSRSVVDAPRTFDDWGEA